MSNGVFTLVSTKTFSAGSADFNDVNVTVPKNGSVQLEVRGDFTTAVTGTFQLALTSANVTAQDSNSSTLSTSNITAPGTGPVYTFVASGQATLSKNSGSPSSAILRAGITDTEIARVGFNAQDDDLNLRELYLNNNGTSVLSDVVSSIKLVDENGAILANGVVVNKTVRFSVADSAFVVPKNTSSRYAKVLLSISADSITDAALTNKSVNLVTGINSTDFTAVAGTVNGVRLVSKATGNDVATINSANGTSVSNSNLVTRSTIIVAAPATGDYSRQTFTVSAGTSNKVQLAGFKFDTNVAGLTAKVYKDSVNAGNQVATTATITTVTGSTNTVTFSTPVEISAGTTMTFYVDYTGVTSSTNGTSIRTFKISDASYNDVMNTGGNVLVTSVSTYNNTGVPTVEQQSKY